MYQPLGKKEKNKWREKEGEREEGEKDMIEKGEKRGVGGGGERWWKNEKGDVNMYRGICMM